MLPRRETGIAGEDATRHRRMIAVPTREHRRGRTRVLAASAGSLRHLRVGERIRLTGRRLLGVVDLLHRIRADDRRGPRGVRLTRFARIWTEGRRLLHRRRGARAADARGARTDPTLALQAQRDGALRCVGTVVVRRNGPVDVEIGEAGVHLASQAAPPGFLRREFMAVAVLRTVMILVEGGKPQILLRSEARGRLGAGGAGGVRVLDRM